METIEIESVCDYIAHLQHKRSMLWSALYRGQSDHELSLVPSLFRLKLAHDDWQTWESYERHILRTFKNLGSPYISPEVENTVDLMVLAQHHGLPTRLLDWTENPLTALFFAVENQREGRDAAVFELLLPEASDTTELEYNENGLSLEKLTVLRPKHVTERVNRQFGCFTIQPLPADDQPPSDLVELLKDREHHLRKFLLRVEHKDRLKRELDMLGINYFTLFPDLEGLSKQIRWELRAYGLVNFNLLNNE